jgi:hypothetical protein
MLTKIPCGCASYLRELTLRCLRACVCVCTVVPICTRVLRVLAHDLLAARMTLHACAHAHTRARARAQARTEIDTDTKTNTDTDTDVDTNTQKQAHMPRLASICLP